MATNNLTFDQQLEKCKTTYPRIYYEYKCFDFIKDAYSEQIATAYKECDSSEMVGILVSCGIDEDFEDTYALTFSKIPKSGLKQFLKDEPYHKIIDEIYGHNKIPIFCEWTYSPEFIDRDGIEYILERKPFQHLGVTNRPFEWASPIPKSAPPAKKVVTPEKNLEQDLLKWLHSRGIKADNQISTAKHRMDIWIPGRCFLELKRGKVSGDDVCQAIDYCAEYKKPVVLVGNHISEMASRGIEAFNKAVESEMLIFVSWSAVKTYLKGLLFT